MSAGVFDNNGSDEHPRPRRRRELVDGLIAELSSTYSLPRSAWKIRIGQYSTGHSYMVITCPTRKLAEQLAQGVLKQGFPVSRRRLSKKVGVD